MRDRIVHIERMLAHNREAAAQKRTRDVDFDRGCRALWHLLRRLDIETQRLDNNKN